MGRRKWKLYQEVLARSHLNANHSTASAAVANVATPANDITTDGHNVHNDDTVNNISTSTATNFNNCIPPQPAETSTSESGRFATTNQNKTLLSPFRFARAPSSTPAMPGANCSNGSTTPPSTTTTPPLLLSQQQSTTSSTQTATTTNHHNHTANRQSPHSQSPVAAPPSESLPAGHDEAFTNAQQHPNTRSSPSPNLKCTSDLQHAAEATVDSLQASTTSSPPPPAQRLPATATTAIDVIKREPADDAGAKAIDTEPTQTTFNGGWC